MKVSITVVFITMLYSNLYTQPFSSENKAGTSFSQDCRNFLGNKYGSSKDCNNDLVCFLEGWCDQSRAVALMLMPNIINGGCNFCSGALVMNAKKDFSPYFLTAYHCIDQNDDGKIDELERKNISNYTFVFNYERPKGKCDDATSTQPSDTFYIKGAELVAERVGADMAILRLSTRPPIYYNVAYAGWDRRLKIPKDGVGIHHPVGDVKKITFYKENPILSLYPADGGYTVNSWMVNYNDGITEGGSSGSPLFNESGQVVGILSGGNEKSCSDGLWGRKHYGRLEWAWWNDEGIRKTLDPNGGDGDYMNLDYPCQIELQIKNAQLASYHFEGKYYAMNDIETIEKVLLNSNETASFNAGNTIVLKDGFHAKQGSNFTAQIQSCKRGCN